MDTEEHCMSTRKDTLPEKDDDATTPQTKERLRSIDSSDSIKKDRIWLAEVEKRYNSISGEGSDITLNDFKKVLNVKKNTFFAERFFQLIDEDHSGTISKTKLDTALRLLVFGTSSSKFEFLFKVYDVDGNGFVDFDELRFVLKSCIAESALTLSEETLTELTETFFDEADVDGDGNVTIEELYTVFNKYPSIAANLSISASQLFSPGSSGNNEKKSRTRIWRDRFTLQTVRNNASIIFFTILYILINLGLVGWGIYTGYSSNPPGRNPAGIIIARAAGRPLSFNCSFVVVLMLRKVLTFLRDNRTLSRLLPLDHHVTSHKVVGIIIVILTVVHVVGHLINFSLIVRENPNGTTLAQFLFTPVPGVGWVAGAASLTGDLLIVVLLIMVVCSMSFIRRNRYFQVFYWTHQLCIVFWILLILHSTTFWMWFIAPGLLYILERLRRLQIYKRFRFGRTYILEGFTLPANVTHLVIQRPPNFRYQAGAYIFVNIPSITDYEWHPFTISSAPDQKGFISLHIRSVGHWTKRLYDKIKETEETQLTAVDVHDERAETPHVKQPMAILEEDGVGVGDSTETPTGKTEILVTSTDGEVNEGYQEDHDTSTNNRKVSIEIRPVNEATHTTDFRTRRAEVAPALSTKRKMRKASTAVGSRRRRRRSTTIIMNRRRESSLHSLDATAMVSMKQHTGLEIILDGPYGTPSQHIMEAEHAVLIASGIGVTPFASILQSIHQQYKAAKKRCPNCTYEWVDDVSSITTMKKVDFYWINRNQHSFEWFLSLLNHIEVEQREIAPSSRFLDIHLYITSALEFNDMKAMGLHVALDLIHQKTNKDTITGLMTKTNPGRPNWDEVFQDIKQQNSGRVTVFFCGSPALGNILRAKCLQHGMAFRKENF